MPKCCGLNFVLLVKSLCDKQTNQRVCVIFYLLAIARTPFKKSALERIISAYAEMLRAQLRSFSKVALRQANEPKGSRHFLSSRYREDAL